MNESMNWVLQLGVNTLFFISLRNSNKGVFPYLHLYLKMVISMLDMYLSVDESSVYT